jgi:hypothetical protein
MQIHLNDDPNSSTWHLSTSGAFSIKSLYEDYMNNDTQYF